MEIPKWVNEIFFNKKFRVWKHLAFWIFIYADEVLSWLGLTDPMDVPFYIVLLEVLGDMVMVYVNIYFLLPRLFLKGRLVSYLSCSVILILMVVFANYLLYYDPAYEVSNTTFIVSTVVNNVVLLFMAIGMKLIQLSYSSSTHIQKLKEDKLETELAYLRTQVNPHFLFNTLNNIYVMAKKKDEFLPDTIMQLSDLLRYQLYDCDADTVPLKNEITYLKNYLKLEGLRRQHLKIELDITGEVNSIAIRPLIILPYIENAFKYSNNGSGSDYIRLQIKEEAKDLYIEIENSKGTLHRRDVGGIGMVNARRRLELAYPDRHELELLENEQRFLVKLKIMT